jgi:DNA-binding SARP family transcriptional activator
VGSRAVGGAGQGGAVSPPPRDVCAQPAAPIMSRTMLRLRFLGPTSALLDGAPVDLGGPRQRAVLALLAAGRGDTVSTDRISDLLWRGDPPRGATASLQAYVSNLRRALEPDRAPRTPARILVSTPPGYALRLPEECVDAWHFEAALHEARELRPVQACAILREALGWWLGPALAEVADQEWAGTEIARLTELRLAGHEALIAATTRAGQSAEAVELAEAFTREHPLREEGWRLLAEALDACGRRADALATLDRARSTLAAEIGLDPGPGLAWTERALLHQPSNTQAAAETSGDPLFVGRGDELAALEAAATRAREQGGLVLVTGEAGVGKSALLARFAQRLAATGWIVLPGRCPEYDGAPPAWAWAEALRVCAERVPPPPDSPVRTLLETAAPTTAADATAGRFRLHQAVLSWLETAAGSAPLAVLIDDLHRADMETLALLEHVAAAAGRPFLVCAAYRASDADDRLTGTLALLAALAPLRLALDGLPPPDALTLARALCGDGLDQAALRTLAERTGGNPFFLRECARLGTGGQPGKAAGANPGEAAGAVPEGVRDVVRRRVARLPEHGAAVLRIAAVLGRDADVNVLIDAAEAAPDAVLDGLEAAVDAGLLVAPAPGRVGFGHALVRDTVYADLTWLRRARLHLRVAGTLERLHPEDAAALAHHYAQAQSPAAAERAVVHSLHAAELAEHRYAHETAERLYQQAVSALGLVPVPPGGRPERDERTVDLLGRLLRAQVRAGHAFEARGTRQRALDIARAAGRDDLLIAAFSAWTEPTPGKVRSYTDPPDAEIVDTVERLLKDGALDPATRCHLLGVLIQELAETGSARCIEAIEEQQALAPRTGDPLIEAAALGLLRRLTPRELHDGWDVAADRLRELAGTLDLPAYQWHAEQLGAIHAAAHGDPVALRRHLEDGLVLARRYQLAEPEATNRSALAMLAHIQGRFEEAEEHNTRARELLLGLGSHHANPTTWAALFTIRINQGRYEEAEACTRRMYPGFVPSAMVALALAGQGQTAKAASIYRYDMPVERSSAYSANLSMHSQLVVLTKAPESAHRLIEMLIPLRDHFGGATSLMYAFSPLAFNLGELYRLLGDEAAARREFEHAETVARRWQSPYWQRRAEAAAAGASADELGP